jgi:hypothetical protein
MDVKKVLVKLTLFVSGTIILSKSSQLTALQVQETILSPWTKIVAQTIGASLMGLGAILPSKDN